MPFWKRIYLDLKNRALKAFLLDITDWLAIVLLPAAKVDNNSLLIVRLDAIGDYILFRNSLYALKQTPAFQGKKITLLGNGLWRNLYETFDTNFADEVIWISRLKFTRAPLYRYRVLKQLKAQGYGTMVLPAYSRDFYVDRIAKILPAASRIASAGGLFNSTAIEKAKADGYFTQLVPARQGTLFEFNRNAEFVNGLGYTGAIPFELNARVVDLPFTLPVQFSVVFPGASLPIKHWPNERFAAVASKLIALGYQVIIAGAPGDAPYANEILSHLATNDAACVTNLCGKTSLSQLAGLLSRASLLVCNDTGALHMAAAMNIPAVCVSNLYHYGLFVPYPEALFPKGRFVFPETSVPAAEVRGDYKSLPTVKAVPVDAVWAKVEEVLSLSHGAGR